MDPCLITIIIALIVFIVGIILIIVIGMRPKFLCTIPNRDLLSYKHELLNRLNARGYKIKERKNGNIFVQKNTFSATTLVFKQNGQNVDILFIHSNSNAILIVFILSFITFWIVAIILAIIADSNSKDFRNNELKPILTGYEFGRTCPNCGRSIPMDAHLCPYCTTQF